MYVSQPLCPFSPKCVSSFSLVSVSLFYTVSSKLQNHSFHTFNTPLPSRVGWLCEVCRTVDFLLLFPIYCSSIIFHYSSYSYCARFSAPLLHEILWFTLQKTEFIRGCLQENHTPRTPSKSQVCLCLSVSVCVSLSCLFFSLWPLSSQYCRE